MIGYLKGQILAKSQGRLLLLVQDIGYEVFVAEPLLLELKIGEDQELYIHQNIKEDSSDLYGFKTLPELELFRLLLSVNGIGPKSALAILHIASVADVEESIARGDAGLLTKVSGIGQKIAQRVVLELRNKVGFIDSGRFGHSDEIDALMALGYSLAQAREALKQVPPEISESGERIREALKAMKK